MSLVSARRRAISDETNSLSPLFEFFNQGRFQKYALDEIAISPAISMWLRESKVNEEDQTKTLYYLDQK